MQTAAAIAEPELNQLQNQAFATRTDYKRS
jgi:hypothetical protein